MNRYLMTFAALCLPLLLAAQGFAGIRQSLRQSAVSQVQEKVWLHTDNECYFVGDTLWYKAYVVRADNLRPTNMSRILYVELLSPDGLLVERQNVIVSSRGFSCGQFVLRDSLYSGYYELRAYTRWMLNFGVGHARYSRDDTWLFYNKQMAADYYRTWDGLFSRVLPVYSKPETPGDYDARRMYQRPRTRLPKVKKDNLLVTFYPEGGHLVEGVENRVAFEAVDQHGEAQNLKGQVLFSSGRQPLDISAVHMGRGSFTVVPDGRPMTARFSFRGRQYDFPLPKAEPDGVSLMLNGDKAVLQCRQSAVPPLAVAVLCRGALHHFDTLSSWSGRTVVTLPADSLPTGVNELVVFDAEGRIRASRLFFVNHHEHDAALITAPLNPRHSYQPYEQIQLPVTVSGVSQPTVFSLSVRDANTDEPTYNDGNVLTDLLLSSDLRGFIARPAYYFEAADDIHRAHLDLLMQVQGWRRYPWQELTDTTRQMRYQPEQTMTVAGCVYKMLDVSAVEPDEVARWQQNQGAVAPRTGDDDTAADPFADAAEDSGIAEVDNGSSLTAGDDDGVSYAAMDQVSEHLGVNHGNLRHEVLVEAEIVMPDGVVGGVQKTTDRGRFLFQIPPFYGATFLNLKAYQEKDSLRKSMASRSDAAAFQETAYPDYYVKRDMDYPVLAREYSYYQKHAPEWMVTIDEDSLSEWSMENDVHQLRNLDVKGHRRGRRAVDWSKPAAVYNAYSIYNSLTDYGLSFGYFDMRLFPRQVANFLFGNMNRYNTFHVDGRLNGATYWRNYSPVAKGAVETERAAVFSANRTAQAIYRDIRLSRLKDVRVYTDYEPRNADSTMVEERYTADATVEMVPIDNDGRQVVYRDRHIYLQGFSEPARFYQPDYSQRQPSDPADYRRTLYWNPNAVTDGEGRFTATFYNNGKETRIKMSAAGVSGDGRLLHSK